MNIFKLDINSRYIHVISKENIEKFTYRRAPWLQIYEGKQSWFAVCPGCDNPIQIVGLFSDRISPYGKHFVPQGSLEQKINGIVDEDAKDNCSYYRGRKPYNGYIRPPESPIAKTILEILVEQFDRVIYVLEKTIGIKITVNLATQMLRDYKASNSWLYPTSTLENIPWVFAGASKARTIIGRIILDTAMIADLQQAFNKLQLVKFNKNNQIIAEQGTGEKLNYNSLGFCLIHHKQVMVENILNESMDLIIFTSSGDNAPPPIYSKTINFDHQYFRNLIQSSSNKYRKPELIALAKQILFGDA